MIELMAPAGDLETLKTAFYFGADSVYVGGPKLQLRAEKSGFSEETLEEAVNYAHACGKKVYVAVNSFAFDEEIREIPDYARFLYRIGTDGVIVADLGVLTAIRSSVPDLEIHISTQFNCTNSASANLLYSLGAKRVVPARELSLDQIRSLSAGIPDDMTVEAFIHGAMCMSFSGRCILSSYFNGRSANRGDCTQPCRWKYTLSEEKRPGSSIPIEEEGGYTAILSSHDLCTVGILDDIIKAGATSLKIEGRMKTEYYVATVVNAYRMRILGEWDAEKCLNELEKVTHRPYSTGFYLGDEKRSHNNDGEYRTSYRYVGKVIEQREKSVLVQQRNAFEPGDTLEVLTPGDTYPVRVTGITDTEGNDIIRANRVKQELLLSFEEPVDLHPGDLLRKRTNTDNEVE